MIRPGRTPRWRGRAPWLVLALRVIVLSLSVQTGGMARDVADVVWAFAVGADAPDVDDDCLLDHGACHCPPGCPNCHCSHGVASLPQRLVATPLGMPMNVEVVRLTADDQSPPLPEPGSLYRPPRASRSVEI